MFTNPTPDKLLEGVIIALQQDILPNLTNEKAQVVAVMMQAVVQQVRQVMPAYLGTLAVEHNNMARVLTDIGAIIGETPGDAAGRIRERGAAAANIEPIALVPGLDDVIAAHRALGTQLVETMRDLDILAMAGSEQAEAALTRLRAHLGPRAVNDFMSYVVGAGMAGRG